MSAPHGRPSVLVVVPTLTMLLFTLAGCHGGGGGGDSNGALILLDANAESLGALPVSDGYLDSRIVFEFSKDVDPTSVTPQAMRVVLDADPTTSARGSLRVFGHEVVFAPQLPIRADLDDAAYDVGANGIYRVEVDASPTGPRGRDGSMLETSFRSTFAVRTQPPLFSDRHPSPPHVIGVLVDLDGDGVLEGDGLCRAVRQPEQFLDARAAEYSACTARNDLFDLATTPLVSGARVGSALRPLTVALLISEPLSPASVFAGTDRADPYGLATNFRVTDLTNRVDSDGDGQPDSDRPLPFRASLVQEVRVDVDPIGRDYVLVVLELAFTAPPLAQIRVDALGGLVELADPTVAIAPFGATLQTAATPPTDDAIVEEFDDVRRLDRASTAHWNFATPGTLRSGTGFGGSGIDGSFPPPGGETSFVLDTNAHDGIFQFTSFTIPPGVTVTATGPIPLRILSIGDVTIAGTLRGDGQRGTTGTADANTPQFGGAGGPGGGMGGRALAPTSPNDCPLGTDCFSESGGGTGGGTGGRRADNAHGISGGGGAGSYAAVGGPAGGGGVPGIPGPTYGNSEIEPLIGGSGGGGGGNKPLNGRYLDESTGGGGGGAGGAVLMQSGGTVDVTGMLTANGGDGGCGSFRPGLARPASAGGGGGSGGAIKIQARRIATIPNFTSAIGGVGGLGIANEGDGGSGGLGRIRLEYESGSPSIGPSVLPPPSIAPLDPRLRMTSFAQSRWIDTNAPSARFAFDGSDPLTGLARLDPNGIALPSVTDVAFIGAIDSRMIVRFLFAGARAKTTNPNEADPATDTGFVRDIHAIDAHPFVRFRIEFEGAAPLPDLPEVVIDRVRIRFQYP